MRVSVIIAAYNVEKYIARAIASVQAQTCEDWEIVVVDDASTDRTCDVVEELASRDARIRLLRHKSNQGPGAARNTAIDVAQGEWIAVLDADDACRPERLEKMLGAATHTGADFIADNQIFYDEALQREVGIAHELSEEWIWITAEEIFRSEKTMRFGEMQPLIRRSFIAKHGLRYNPKFRFGEDLYFTAELLFCGARAILLAQPYYIYTTPFGFLSRQRSAGSRTVNRLHILLEGVDDLVDKHRATLSPALLRAIASYRARTHRHWVFRELTRLRCQHRIIPLAFFTATHPVHTTSYIAQSQTYRSLTSFLGIR